MTLLLLLPLLILGLAMDLAAFLLFGADKRRAARGRRRIPERVLLASALLGGSLGALAGMQIFRHKTRHRRFSLGLPLIFLLQTAFLLYLAFQGGFFHG